MREEVYVQCHEQRLRTHEAVGKAGDLANVLHSAVGHRNPRAIVQRIPVAHSATA